MTMPSFSSLVFVLFVVLASFSSSCSCSKLDPSTTIYQYLDQLNITVEDHFVTTPDGYILHVFHLPPPSSQSQSAPVVLFQHGILASAWCWIINSQNNYLAAPALKMRSLGYDVWLTNSRGNDFSANHTTLSTNSKAFWDYTYNDMGHYDEPAVISYILSVTGRANLTYVGWSQGVTSFLISGSRPDLAEDLANKVNLFVALSPVSYMKHQSSLLLGALSKLGVASLLASLFPYSFLSGSVPLHDVEEVLCKLTLGVICSIAVDTVCGSSALDDPQQIENIAAHFPAGTSVKDMNHYSQWISASSSIFRQYDYGREGNLAHYNSTSPPDYDLSLFRVRSAFFRGSVDALVSASDFESLRSSLTRVQPGGLLAWEANYDTFSHLTWMVGRADALYWMSDFQALVNTYNPL